jgi:hypothetical protein
LTADEEVSLASIRRHLGRYEICFVAPESLDLAGILQGGEEVVRFPDEFFSGIAGYNRLLKSSGFYKRFKRYDYILIAQLDCLIFSGNLDEWMSQGWDYLAAPWFKGFSEDCTSGLWRVGNGGLSLRRVSSHLRVLRQKLVKGTIYPRFGNSYWKESRTWGYAGLYRKLGWMAGLFTSRQRSTVEEELDFYPYNEDVFWSIEAQKFDSSFTVATAKEALPFAFEVDPRWCYELNGRKLPFGCHAWGRYDRGFWEDKIGIKNL